MIQRNIIILIVIAAFVTTGFAAEKPAAKGDWRTVVATRTGMRVQVVETNLKSTIGKFVRANETELVLTAEGKEVTIPRERIFRVSEYEGRARNAMWGAIGGAALGAGIGAGCARETHEPASCVGALMALFGAIGGGIGAAVSPSSPIYIAETPPKAAASPAR